MHLLPRLCPALGAAALSIALLAGTARAAGEPAAGKTVEGTVVAIDNGDLVVDLGSGAGVRAGQIVELWRPMRLRHPVTGRALVDRFRIGTVRLVDVEGVLSLGRVETASARAPAAGDHVVVPAAAPGSEPPAAPRPTEPPRAAAAAAPPTVVLGDPEAKELSDLFASLDGVAPEARIDAYRSFVAARPRSRFGKVLREEIEALTRTTAAAREPELQRAFLPIERLRPGAPQRFAIELDPRFVGAVVHVRSRGASSYRSIRMESVGPRYWAATLPGDAVQEPGMEYFVEGVARSGAAVAVVGSAAAPRDSVVDPHPVTGKRPGTLAQAALSSEIATFNTKKANDWVFQTEGAFGWRLRDVGVRAVRSGFGVLRGKGGTLVDLDELGRPPRDVGLTYGWIETELATSRSFALIGRPILGLREGGVTGGAQGFFRVGSDLATNLVIGGEVLGTVGLRGIVQLEWRTIPRVPIMVRSEVTNQPAGTSGDIGARAIAQVGYEIAHGLAVSARLSYQGRTIAHAGPGAGAGVSYQW